MCRPVGASSGLLTPRRPLPWLGFPVFPAHPAAFLCTAHFDRLAAMHLLYLDDAGSVGNVREQYLVLGGVSVFEAQSSWVTQQLESPRPRAAGIVGQLPRVRGRTPGLPRGGDEQRSLPRRARLPRRHNRRGSDNRGYVNRDPSQQVPGARVGLLLGRLLPPFGPVGGHALRYRLLLRGRHLPALPRRLGLGLAVGRGSRLRRRGSAPRRGARRRR